MISMAPEEFKKALELFSGILIEHIDGKRRLTTLTITRLEDRITILEDVNND